ncbi:MAG TPA: PepSY domain-containing protein, partial [Miltoncostaeaceae bacterium]|nr:PepSY domain-containing protein [Miltoncostaeaceae bacterium]
ADTHDLAPGSSSIQLPTGAEHGERTDGARDEHADNEREGAGESATDRQQEAAEAAETLKLAQSAKVNAAQAETAALAKVPGWVTEAQLENDNGNAVWEVEVITKDGTQHELKIDAGTAKVLSAQVDQPD